MDIKRGLYRANPLKWFRDKVKTRGLHLTTQPYPFRKRSFEQYKTGKHLQTPLFQSDLNLGVPCCLQFGLECLGGGTYRQWQDFDCRVCDFKAVLVRRKGGLYCSYEGYCEGKADWLVG